MVSDGPDDGKVISPMRLIPLLTRAVQDLTDMVVSCQAQILDLETEIGEFKSK